MPKEKLRGIPVSEKSKGVCVGISFLAFFILLFKFSSLAFLLSKG